MKVLMHIRQEILLIARNCVLWQQTGNCIFSMDLLTFFMYDRTRSGTQTSSKEAVTRLLNAYQAGDKAAMDQLMPVVYNEMRNLASKKLRYERKNHTFDTTALVHEAYFRLIDQENVQWQSRSHFLAIAAQAMRRILMNYAEKRRAVKRGRGFKKLNINVQDVPDTTGIMDDTLAEDIVKLHSALKQMEKFNERGCRVVEYHYFGGLTWDEIAEVMGLSNATVRRAWNVAKLWLQREMKGIEL